VNSFKNEIIKFAENAKVFSSETLVGQYIKHINELFECQDPLYISNYLPIIEKEKCTFDRKKPFLSVVMRTQGTRHEMLREALHSLWAQTDKDFEVLLIGHKLSDEQYAELNKIINEFPPIFKAHIRFIRIGYGNRATPLNIGFSYAHGEYIAVLDDDDIVFDNWVEEFHKAAKKTPGKLLHAYVAAQRWEKVDCGGIMKLRACGSIELNFCCDFVMFRQLSQNFCPLLGLAFPAYVFQKIGVIFDETLDTAEDWDVLMRTAFLTGVIDINEPTSLYRLWVNTENSQTLHDKTVWEANFYRIQKKFEEMPIILPAKSQKTYIYKLKTELYKKLKKKIRRLMPQKDTVTVAFNEKIYRVLNHKNSQIERGLD